MKQKLWLMFALLSQLVLSCKKELAKEDAVSSQYNKPVAAEKGNSQLTIAIVSDIHYMDPSLLINNGAVAESSQQITKPMVAGNAKEISQTTSSEVPIKDETTRLKETVYVKAQSENPNISTNNAVEQSNSKKDGITTTSNQNQVSGTSVPEQSSVSAKDPTKDGNNITSNEIVTQKGVTNRYETTKPVTTSSVLPVLSEPISIRTSSTEQPVQLNTKTNTIKPVRKLKNKVNEPFINEEVNTNDGNYIYTIQLDASWDFADPKSYKDKYNLPFDVVCVKRNGVLKYYTGRYLSRADATADIARYGLAGYIVNIEESREVNGSNVKK